MDIYQLRKRKEEKNLTNMEVARRAGLPLRTVENVLQGRTLTPRIDTIEAIARAIGVSLEDEEPKYTITDKEKRLLDMFGKLIPSVQDYVLQTVEKFLQTQESAKTGSSAERITRRYNADFGG